MDRSDDDYAPEALPPDGQKQFLYRVVETHYEHGIVHVWATSAREAARRIEDAYSTDHAYMWVFEPGTQARNLEVTPERTKDGLIESRLYKTGDGKQL